MACYSHLFKTFPQFVIIHTFKGFGIVNEAEAEKNSIFFECPCLFCDPTDVSNLVSGSSAFSKSSLYIWKSAVHMMLKDFEHNLASM